MIIKTIMAKTRSKRKKENSSRPDITKKRCNVNCILHVNDIQHVEFISLCSLKRSAENLMTKLHNIGNGQLLESHDSPQWMEMILNLKVKEGCMGTLLSYWTKINVHLTCRYVRTHLSRDQLSYPICDVYTRGECKPNIATYIF